MILKALHRQSAILSCLALSILSAPAASASGTIEDPLRFEPGVAKQSRLLTSFAALKNFVRRIPDSAKACISSLKSEPESLKILEADESLRLKIREIFEARVDSPGSSNCLGFVNVPREFSKILETDLGVCSGVTYMAWLTNYLAVWDSAGESLLKHALPATLPEGWDAARVRGSLERWKASGGKNYNPKDKEAVSAFFEPYLKRLYSSKEVTIIPYFENLEQLSSHPALKDAMKRVAISKWKTNNLTPLALFEMAFSDRKIGNSLRKPELLRAASKSDEYLRSGIAPVLFFTLPKRGDNPLRLHVVRVKKVVRSKDGDHLSFIVVDPNFLAPDNLKIIRVAGLNAVADDGEVQAVYSRYQSAQLGRGGEVIQGLSELEIEPWFEFEAIEMLQAWKRFLKDLPEESPAG